MSAAIRRLGSTLNRVIIVRQLDSVRWTTEGYERAAGQWRFTWLLHPATREDVARRHADRLASASGLPVGEQRLGQRIRLIGGVLVHVAGGAA